MRIAIIGSGIAGNAAALALTLGNATNDVVIYEKSDRPGGHSATVDVDYDGHKIPVDTGFIVYNEQNYPNFTAMMEFLGVETQMSSMSFSVSADLGRYEWCGRDGGLDRNGLDVVDGLFAQRRNFFSPKHLKMLLEILKFQKQATLDVRGGTVGEGTLRDYFTRYKFSNNLRDNYLVPMGAAIWSTSPKQMLDFPARSFFEFFDNHCLLQWQRPIWRTVTGGSRSYVKKLVAHFGNKLRLSSGVTSVRRLANGVEVTDETGRCEIFDQVVIGAHAPDALAMLADADDQERAILGACNYSDNDVWLHRDAGLMPKRKAAWAAWNFLREGDASERKVAVTYWMNELQGINKDYPLFVTLNPPREPKPETVFGRWSFAHPQFDSAALSARDRLSEIQGRRNVWFCGAWTAHGFHEDGLASGLAVAAALGCKAPWHVQDPAWREAAE